MAGVGSETPLGKVLRQLFKTKSRHPTALYFTDFQQTYLRKGMSEQLLFHQLVLLGKIVRAPAGDPMTADVFANDTLQQHVAATGWPAPPQRWPPEASLVHGSLE